MLQKSVDGVSTARWIGSIGLAAVVGIAYFLAARLSLFLLTQPEGLPFSGRLRVSPRASSSFSGVMQDCR